MTNTTVVKPDRGAMISASASELVFHLSRF